MAGYREVRDAIVARITSQQWEPGDLLPAEQMLAEEFGCTRATVNRAMQEIADAGLIERRRKAGTRVVRREHRGATLTIPLIRREIENRGQRYDYLLIDCALAPAPAAIRMAFSLNAGQSALHLRCLHFADGVPYQLEDRWINLEAVPEARDQDFAMVNPNEWLVGAVPFSSAEHVFSAGIPDPEEAELLKLRPGEPVFVIERLTWLNTDTITRVRLLHPGHAYRLTTRDSDPFNPVPATS